MSRKKFEKATIALQIETCQECPFVKSVRTLQAGMAYDYHCSHGVTVYSEDAVRELPRVMYYVEGLGDEEPVPDWCPIKLKGSAETIAALLQKAN